MCTRSYPIVRRTGALLLNALLTAMLLFHVGSSPAQWDIPVPLELTGEVPSDRQVIGPADPVEANDAVSLDAARMNVYARTSVNGSASLIGQLIPVPEAYTAGMIVTILPTQVSSEAATLDLNGLGPRFIVKTGGIPLAAGDLQPGMPARLIFDGQYFQLISASLLRCPSGYTAVHRSYCIADRSQNAATFFDAALACTAQGARLCTISEWNHACHILPGFFATVLEAEWVDHAANSANGAKLVGYGINGADNEPGSGCDHGGQNLPTVPFRYRCCTVR